MLLTAPKALDNAEVPEVWGHTEMRRDHLWSCFEVSLVCFTQQGKYIFKIPLGFCFLLGSSPQVFLSGASTFSLSLDSHIPGNLGPIELGGDGGAHLDVERAERGQSPSESAAGMGLLVGQPWSSAGSVSSPRVPVSPQPAWQAQPEPGEREIRRYPTLDLKRGKCGDFL